MTTFATITAIGMIAGLAMGGNVVTSVGLWIALVASFALGHRVGVDEGASAVLAAVHRAIER